MKLVNAQDKKGTNELLCKCGEEGTQEREKEKRESKHKQSSVILELFLSKKCALFGQIALRKRTQQIYITGLSVKTI